jgi:hypothetical protein
VKPEPKHSPEYIGGEKGRVFFTGGRKQKDRLIYLARLFRVIPETEKSGVRSRILEELFSEPLKKGDYNYFLRFAEALRDSQEPLEWGPVQSATYFVFVARVILEQKRKPIGRASLKELALKLWAEHRINLRPGSQHTINVFDLKTSDALALEQEVKKLPAITWAHVWKNTGF